jgi:predicted transcriptional regulator of viral defense system
MDDARRTRSDMRKQEILGFLADQPRRFTDLRKIAGSFRIIQEMLDEGSIEKIGIGVYGIAGRNRECDSLAAFAMRYPEAVVCLDTAAAYHGLTTQNPHQIHAAFLYGKDAIPRTKDDNVKSYRWRIEPMQEAIDQIVVGGVTVKMTSQARTVIDLLRFMSRSGENEHAIEALNSYTARGGDLKALMKLSKKLRCEATVRPYLMMAGGLRSMP